MSVNTGTNTITTVSSSDSWGDTDAITIESQTCTSADAYKFIDLDLTQTTVIPDLARGIWIDAVKTDTGAAHYTTFSPWAAFGAGSDFSYRNAVAGVGISRPFYIPLIQRRFCYRSDASGAGTATDVIKIMGVDVATP